MNFVFQFESFLDFMTMSGHGSYVWVSYLLTFICLLVLTLMPIFHKKQLAKQVQRQQRIRESINDKETSVGS